MSGISYRISGAAAILMLILGSCALAAETTPADPDVVPFSDRFPVEISVSYPSQVYDLAALGLDIDSAGDGLVRAYVNEEEMTAVRGLGFEIRRIPNEALRMWRTLRDLEALGIEDVYHDYDGLTTYLQGVAADHSDITRLMSIGKTVENRELWFLKITDHPDSQENEPEFKYISTMHGDEVVGVENCLKFIDWLTDNYDSASPDPWLKNIVDEVEIWVMPMMNPDGNAAGSRYNANGVDLNRSFPDLIDDPYNTPVGREPEIQAVMIFSDSMAFDLSANFHGGALVVNYPHDNRYARAPDDSLYINMSKAYSYHNPPMWNSSTFDYGITNGYDWYEVHGSMQDWNYDYAYNMEVTIEISQNKWPPASQLPQYWADNDTSMVAYLEYCLRGLRGVVTDSLTGEPLAAVVTVDGIEWDDRTDPDVGDYHRILDPGTYSVTFSAPDYLSKRFSGIEVTAGPATVLDVELAQAERVAISGIVSSSETGPILASVEARYHGSGEIGDSTTTDPADGSYSLDVAQGEYDITARADGHRTETVFAGVYADTTVDFLLDPTSGDILVIDDYSGLMAISKSPDRDVAVNMPVFMTSAADITLDLEMLGYAAVLETAAATDPKTWTSYDFIVWSSGDDTSPVSTYAYRRELIDYVTAGGSLLIEGGELAYDAANSPGYPNFADSVLHVDEWRTDDAGPLVLIAGQSGHAIVTSPNTLPAGIDVSYGGYGDEDAASPAGGAYPVYGTSSYPSDAGLLVYDNEGKPQIVFYAFAYSSVTDRAEARNMLENTVTYLLDEAAGIEPVAEEAAGSVSLAAAPNPFAGETVIRYDLPERSVVRLEIFDIEGRLVRTLVHAVRPAGRHSVAWSGCDERGRAVGPGLFFIRMKAGGLAATGKILLMR